jgi:hypothetical protein
MAIIQSGATTDLLTVDPVSKAARVTLYRSSGSEIEIDSAPVSSYLLPLNIRQTAATAVGAVVWSMRNTGARTVYLRHLRLIMGFDGAAAAASTPRYELVRFTAATPTAGNALTPIKKRNAYAGSSVGDARELNTGLTVTGVNFESPFLVIGRPIAVTGGITDMDVDFTVSGQSDYSMLELAGGEGLAIRIASIATVIGISLTGMIEWDER